VTAPSANLTALAVAAVRDLADSPEQVTRRWQLQPATVITADTVSPVAVLDGDGVLGTGSTPIPLISLIGYCAVDARVMVLVVPPAGNYAVADLSGAVAVQNLVSTAGTTTSGAYTTTLTGSVTAGVAFVAPASGKVQINYVCALVNSGASITALAPFVRDGETIGSGNTILAAADGNAIYMQGTDETRYGASYLLEDLTPSSWYNVVHAFRVTGGTGTYTNQQLSVLPQRG
jgi:uncharacterized iron-regulated membrane protein